MKTIVVATDFSPVALNAARYAADMAMAISADLYLLNVYQLPIGYGDAPAISIADMQQLAEEDMNEFKNEVLKKRGSLLDVKTEVRPGSFFQELKDVCEDVQPYAVIMGSQGRTAAEHVFLGNHAAYAMKHLNWPAITIPPGIRFLGIKNVGLACDFEKVIDTLPLDEIKVLVKDFHAELHVMNTGKAGVAEPGKVFESGLLQEMLAGLKPRYHLIGSENIDESIMAFAEANHIDLLMILPKRYSLFENLLHKSHTKQFVLHSHVPVMALHQ